MVMRNSRGSEGEFPRLLDEMFTLHLSPTKQCKRSLRVAIAVIILFAVVFVLSIFVLVRLFSNENSGTYPTDQKLLSRSFLKACPMARGIADDRSDKGHHNEDLFRH
jgi:hypothetical protein